MIIRKFFTSTIICLVLFLSPHCNTSNEVETTTDPSLATFKKIDDHPLYQMTYYGDYGFDQFLLEGIGVNDNQESFDDRWGCTCFASFNNESEYLMGRNFDWHDNPVIILFTDPPNGYASVSMVDISYLGFDNSEPTGEEKKNLLRAPFLPFDGMNEKGLAVGMMAVPYAEALIDPGKVTIDCLHAIRLMLDYAKDIEEAANLIKRYNISFDGGPAVHYLVSDAAGNSAVIEFVDNKVVVLEKSENFQVSTNFLFSDYIFTGSSSPCWRYNQVYEFLKNSSNAISETEAINILQGVSQSNTQWSVVYNQISGNIKLVMGRNYDSIYDFRLDQR